MKLTIREMAQGIENNIEGFWHGEKGAIDAADGMALTISQSVPQREAQNEMTRSCVYLFQNRTLILTSTDALPDAPDKHQVSKREYEDWIVENNYGSYEWTVDDYAVWFTRKEAEDYGHARSYNYGEINKDWRVYGVTSNGELATLVDIVTEGIE